MTDINAILADLQFHADPETGALSRAKYREVGTYSTAKIESIFGSFREARRQAGLEYTRGQSQVLSQIARHVSHDDYRNFMIDRKDYGEKYRRPNGKRFQTTIVASDIHDIECDLFWRRVFIDTIKRIQPEKIIFGGDLFDLCEFGKYSVDPRTWDVVGRIKHVHEFFKEIREVAPDAEMTLCEGNHEVRLLRYLTDCAQPVKALLSDLHGFTIPKLLGLDSYEVGYIGRADLGAFTKSDLNRELTKNYMVIYDCFMIDHFPSGKNRGVEGCNGHHHRYISQAMYSHIYGPINWVQLGGGHVRSAEYTQAAEQWDNGFLIVNTDTHNQRNILDYVQVKDFSVAAGKYYIREPNET